MPLITVGGGGGPINARTDPDSGLRFYTWRGVEYPSVTSVRNLAGMPHKLAQWRVNQVIEKSITEFPAFARQINEGTDQKAIATWLRAGANKKRDAAAALGTRVHDAAASGIAVDKAADDVAPFLVHYKRWLAESGVEIIAVERQVWNPSVGYAGTFDLLGRFPKTGKAWMIDIKTGSGTYPEHALQLEAYCRGEFIGENDVIDDEATAMLAQVGGRKAILHLRPDGWSFITIPDDPATWVAFRGLLAFARWSHNNPTIDTLAGATITGAQNGVHP